MRLFRPFRVGGIAGLLVMATACGTPTTPTFVSTSSPRPSAPSLTFVWAMVVDETGVCLDGATVQVVGGHAIGQSLAQTVPCDAWAYDGGVVFRGLVPGVEMVIRATAPGFDAKEMLIVPTSWPLSVVLLTLPRTPS